MSWERLGRLRGRRVLVTGHTGFKGSWLVLWLSRLGCEIHGYSLPPPTTPSLFEAARVRRLVSHHDGDVRDGAHLLRVTSDIQPELLFHLAAQPIVRAGYDDPLGTFATNIMGTVHVCEALRALRQPCTAILVTSDKCYARANVACVETSPLGGRDPYSASKAAADLVAHAYGHAFFARSGVARIATVRAGNVIGGGDWATGRIVPDLVRAVLGGQPARLRNPHARRPWQYVLDPLYGYLLLACALSSDRQTTGPSAWNFGPPQSASRSVQVLADTFFAAWGQGSAVVDLSGHPPEEANLTIDSSKAQRFLGWHTRLSLDDAVAQCARWYRAHAQGQDMRAACEAEIESYMALG